MFWWIIGVIAAVILLYVIWTFNRLVGLTKRAEGAWSDIDVQLKRRWDLVPALVSTVKGYAEHESETLERAVQARTQAQHADSVTQRGASEQNLTSVVRQIFMLSEAYPDLKANQNFLDLSRTLVEIEDHVQYARRYYNAVVRDLNTLVAGFPAMLVAGVTGIKKREFFQLDEAERATPEVALDVDSEPRTK